MFLRLLTLLAGLTACMSACSDFPKDPESSFDELRSDVLKAGVSEAPPWITRGNATAPSGIEAELITAFAESVGTRVEWVWATEQENLEALAQFSLHLAAGGLTDQSPWKKKVSLSKPHAQVEYVVGFPPGVTPPASLQGVEVAVKSGSDLVRTLEKKGARPMETADPFETGLPVAADTAELAEHGYFVSKFDLAKKSHAIAAPPGENKTILELDRFIASTWTTRARSAEDRP